MSSYLSLNKLHSVHSSSFFAGGGCVWFEPSTTFLKKRGLTRSQVVAGKDRGEFFQGGCSFYIKNQLKYEIFNDKKSLQTKKFLSLITKNLN